jgi:two-component system chemotaxis sensor kinase CheA
LNVPSEITSLAQDFLGWLNESVSLEWGQADQTRKTVATILAGVQAGRPLGTALERLHSQLDQVTSALEKFMQGGISQNDESASRKTTDRVFFISEEELPGFQDFIGEAPSHLEDIETGLLALSQGDGEIDVLRIYRPFHTLKGICGFMGLKELNKAAHCSETLLEPYKTRGGRPSAGMVDLLLKVLDAFRAQCGQISENIDKRSFELQDLSPLIAQLEKAALNPEKESDRLVLEWDGEAPTSEAGSVSPGDERTIRIGVEKMDALLEAVSEMAICQTQVTEGVLGMGATGLLASETVRLGKISRQLRDIVLSLRMVPVQPLLTRMTRAIRDLSRKTSKPVLVHVVGGGTELDKRMVEELAEPLLHLVRNAVDHGLETSAERKASGKSSEGRISLRARHQGGDFVLEVEDDGRGLDFALLRNKAISTGRLKADEEASEADLTRLIFEPGFSTASVVTDVSGRGVGLEAVQRKIEMLKGDLQLRNTSGQGCLFTIRIPLTLALMEGILLRVGDQRYVVPAAQVRRFRAFGTTTEHHLGGESTWLETQEGSLPLVDLAEWFGNTTERAGRTVVVEVEAAGRRTSVLVDEVVGKQQVVIKPLGESLGKLKGVTGGAVLGDGKVGLILDVNALTAMRESKVIFSQGDTDGN